MAVSIVSTTISLLTLTLATTVVGIAAWVANIIATAVATGPSYHLNRHWAWARRDASDPWREIAPFWVLSFAGLALSTVAVAVTDSWAARQHLTAPVHTITVLAAHLSGFGALWVVQFVLLDRFLFARPPSGGGTAPAARLALRWPTMWRVQPSHRLLTRSGAHSRLNGDGRVAPLGTDAR
jgi:putative flippase GtrA